MRAMVLTGHGGLDKLVLRDVPTPRPGRGEVLVKVGACGVNNTEINTRPLGTTGGQCQCFGRVWSLYGLDSSTGTSDAETIASWNSSTVAFPRIQGAAIAGRIVEVGSGVDKGLLGERVLIDPQVRNLNLPLRAQLGAYIGSERDGIQLSLIRGARVVAIAGAAKEARIRAIGAHEFVARESGDLRQAVEASSAREASMLQQTSSAAESSDNS